MSEHNGGRKEIKKDREKKEIKRET